MQRVKFQNLLGVEVEKRVYGYVYQTLKTTPHELDWNNRNFVNRYIAECVRFYENGIVDASSITGFSDTELSNVHHHRIRHVQVRKREYSKDLVCGRCKETTVRFEKKQLRSLDEGTTTCFTCDTCGNEWREN